MYIFFLGIIFIAAGIWFYCRSRKIEKQNLEEIENKYREQINKDIEKEQNKLLQIQKDTIQADEKRQDAIQRAAEAQNATQQLLLSEQGRLAAELSKQKEINLLQLKEDYQKNLNELNSLYCSKEQTLEQDYEKHKLLLESDILSIQEKLDDFRARQEAINKAVLREKELQEKEDFYSIQINENDKEDIATLQKMDLQLHNRDVIPKLIWDLFIRRPAQEMIKRITGGREISGIYKITNKKTQEAYVGKTTSISTRWQNHLKTAIGLDAAARSTLHTRLAADGIWNYTFEILEEVPKDQLSARESYYIELYGTKQQLNMKSGDKNGTQ